MPHIDEGALHAYLDGALDEYPASEAEHVRGHLESCGSCREKLEAERDLRERAARILAVAAPEVSAPAFEELRAFQRAHAERESAASPRRARLGWAASVVLAIGVGWALRGGDGAGSPLASEPDGLDPTVTAPPTRVADEARMPGVDVGREVATDAARPDADASERSTDVASGDAIPSRLLPPRVRVGRLSVDAETFDDGGARNEVVPAVDLGEPPLPAPPLEPRIVTIPPLLADASAGGPLEDLAAQDQPDSTPERSRASAEVVTLASRAADRSGVAPFVRDPDSDTREDALEDDGSYSLVVPSLEVMDVRFRGGVRPEGQVVLQRLEGGDTLEVIHLPPEIDPSSLEEPDAEDRELVLQTGSGWIVMRAPVDEERLVELMRRLLDED